MTTATVDRSSIAHATLVALEEEIRTRLGYRRWYRTSRIGRLWHDLEALNNRELRVLLGVARKARRAARPVLVIAITEAEHRALWGDR